MKTNETWRPIVGYEGFYEVSNEGRVKRISAASGAKPGHILKPHNDKNRYLSVDLRANGARWRCYVHRLVADAFLGTAPAGWHVNHKSGDKKDNRLENLEWTTPGENRQHAIHVLGYNQEGANNATAKLTIEEVREVRRLLSEGVTQSRIGVRFGVHQSVISRIAAGKSYRGQS